MLNFDSPRLLADIGGTYARFTLETSAGVFDHSASLLCAEHPDFESAVRAYLNTLPPMEISHAGVAIANPVEGDQVRMTNYHWQFSIEAMRERLGLETLVVVNDFTALAMALPRLSPSDVRQVGGGQARSRSVVGLLGSGTGLGMSALIPSDEAWVSLGSEGGHMSVSPRDEREMAVLRYGWRQHTHVSFERLLSGSGLELMYRALAAYRQTPTDDFSAPDITQRALDGSDALCVETLEVFCTMLGSAAGNLAVTLGALGGIYIGGGIVPRLGAAFDQSGFRARFEDHGRFSAYLASIPTYVITAEHATFIGASAILDTQLKAIAAASSKAILAQIRRARGKLSPAELRVADFVLSQPRTALNEPIAEIAKAAQVSQPTVIRFCRSLGCEGLADFKLRLASGLSSTVPVSHSQVTQSDNMMELGAKVLGNTASAVLQVRDHLNRQAIERALDALVNARRVDFFALGQYGVVAQDAQFKFLRFGIPSSAYTDPRLQLLGAQVLQPGDVAVIISSSGKLAELLEVLDVAKARGAMVLAITASQSQLARRADVALLVDHSEDVATQLPMISRILHLLYIDILAVGVATRGLSESDAARSRIRPDAEALEEVKLSLKLPPSPAHSEPDEPSGRSAGSAALGVSVASPWSKLTSHSR
jgi:glucokinase